MAVVALLVSLEAMPAPCPGSLPGTIKSGPFIDKIIFKVITSSDEQVLALLDNEIDLIGDFVNPSYLPALQQAENVEVVEVPGNEYGYVAIDTAKYPFNITSFRRATALAVDKERISAEVRDGLSQPLDSVVPKMNPFSIERTAPYNYYEANVPLGNQLLDESGFLDVDNDTVREAPNGGEFDVEVSMTSGAFGSYEDAEEVRQILVSALRDLHVNASSLGPCYEITPWWRCCGLDYDMILMDASFANMDVDWLAYEFWSGYADEPYWNLPRFRNASYDSWRNQLLHSTDYDEVYEAATEMQSILLYECPVIVLCEPALLSVYRTDKFEGHINEPIDGVSGWWTDYKVRLKPSHGGPFGGMLRQSSSLDIDTFNFMASSSASTMMVLNQLYDSLIIRDSEGCDMNWLAESYVAETHADDSYVPEGHTRFTFGLVQNATWTDGEPVTAEDVAFSLNFYREASGNPDGADLTDLTAAYATTTYQVVVEFATESYWHLHTIGYKPIIPKHVFEVIGAANWSTWNPQPPSEVMVTSGPFNVSEYVAGEFCEETRNPDYFFYGFIFGDPPWNHSDPTPSWGSLFEQLLEIMSPVGWVVFIGSLAVIVVYALKSKPILTSALPCAETPSSRSEEHILLFSNGERQR